MINEINLSYSLFIIITFNLKSLMIDPEKSKQTEELASERVKLGD